MSCSRVLFAGRLAEDVEKLSHAFKRKRRSQSMENYVETLVVADEDMYKFHKEKTEHYLLVVSSMVSLCIDCIRVYGGGSTLATSVA